MNVTSSVRRSEQPVQIGSRHGYRIDGDVAHLNAELSVPPYHPGGSWALELWASERGSRGGELEGVKVSEVQFELPTPLAPHTHRVEAQTPARLPLQGLAHTMLLALVELDGNERRVHDVASYPALETFPAPHFEGAVGYQIRGHEVALQAAAVANPRAASNVSGTLSLELWASPQGSALAPESGGGVCVASAQLAPIAGGERALELECRAAFNEPPSGSFTLELLLREWTQAFGYVTRDRRGFDLMYHVAAPERVSPTEPVAAVAALEAVVEPVKAVVEPVKAVAPPQARAPERVPPASASVARSRVVSIQTASAEELARVKGLNLKIAKEIVKARPFAALEDLLRVHGVGRKTFDKIRALITL
jgi:competence ComEA-like helix-hairpin-helix protein